jgi:hypothetical protein
VCPPRPDDRKPAERDATETARESTHRGADGRRDRLIEFRSPEGLLRARLAVRRRLYGCDGDPRGTGRPERRSWRLWVSAETERGAGRLLGVELSCDGMSILADGSASAGMEQGLQGIVNIGGRIQGAEMTMEQWVNVDRAPGSRTPR